MFTEEIRLHFKKNDKIIYSFIEKIEISKYQLPTDLFVDLCETIISQQLSDKAALTIWGRFKKLFKAGKITPKALLKMDDEKIRSCGTSYAKVKSLKDLAQKVLNKEIHLEKLREMSDEEVVAELVKVRGIGPWSAEMFLMFALGREDIFSHGDLGLKNAIRKMYGFRKDPTREQVEKIVSKWKPYRTYACRILWQSLSLK